MYRERERDIDIYVCMYVYIYIYISFIYACAAMTCPSLGDMCRPHTLGCRIHIHTRTHTYTHFLLSMRTSRQPQ